MRPELSSTAPFFAPAADMVPQSSRGIALRSAAVSCGLPQQSANTTIDPPASAFSDTQYSESYPDGVENHFWHLARNRLVAATLRNTLPSVARVLEIGCGPAIVLRHLRASNMDCWGCDIGRPAVPVEHADHVFVQQDCLRLDPEFRRSVDALLLLDVLEHIEDDSGFLRAIGDGFPNSRALIVTVPARTELWSNYDEHYGHFRRYTRDSLAAALAAGGLKLLHQRYFFQELYLPMLIAGRMPNQRSTTVPAPSHPSLHKLLGWISGVCSSALPGSLPGTSLIAVAVRN